MPCILVVDDDEAIRQSIGFVLDSIGIECISAESGEQALEAFGRAPLDGAIVDLMMPGICGLETIRRLRARAPDLPVVIVSGALVDRDGGTPDLMRMASGLTDVAVLAKPFKLSELVQTIRTSFGVPVQGRVAASVA